MKWLEILERDLQFPLVGTRLCPVAVLHWPEWVAMRELASLRD
jgi:hypothetical protein